MAHRSFSSGEFVSLYLSAFPVSLTMFGSMPFCPTLPNVVSHSSLLSMYPSLRQDPKTEKEGKGGGEVSTEREREKMLCCVAGCNLTS